MDNILWDKIEQDLGEITDFEVVKNNGRTGHLTAEIRFKSNGVDKVMACNDANFKFFITAAYYVNELINPLKKYTPVS